MNADTPSSIFRFFFLKTIFGTLLLLVTIIAGVMAYRSLVKESFPDIKIPIAIVRVLWPGAPPELVEKKITIPIENQLKSLKGLKKYNSESKMGGAGISVEFQEDQSIESSMQELREAVNIAAGQFPKEAERPLVMQISSRLLPIITFTLYGDIDEVILDRISRRLKERFESIPGVEKAEISGNRQEIIKVLMIPSRLSAMGISPVTVMNALSGTDLFMPVGRFEHQEVNSSLKFDARVRDLETLKALPILRLQGGKGRIVRLGELAIVRREIEDATVRTSTSFEGSEYGNTVNITLYKSPEKDTIKIVTRAKEIVEQAQQAANWPQTLNYKAVSDQAVEIRESLSEVLNNAGQAMIAVFIILVIMLTWRESLVAGLSIPLTFLGTLAVLWGIGYTLNELVFIGLIIAVGLLVDDFILVMEGMHDARSKGLSLAQAQIFTIKTYALPSFSGSVTTILSFLPIMMLGGFIGRIIRVIPVTTVICLALSYIISILIDVPLFSAIFPKKATGTPKQSRVDRLAEQASERLGFWLQRYTVRSKPLAALWLVGTILLFALSILAYVKTPKILNPKRDFQNLGITIELPPGTVRGQSQRLADRVGEVLRPMNSFKNITKYVGMQSPYTPSPSGKDKEVGSHLIGFSCEFVSEKEREKKSYEYLPEIRQILETSLKGYPEALLSITEARGREGFDAPIEIEIYGSSMHVVRQLAKEVQSKLEQIPGAVNVRNNLGKTNTDWRLDPIRESLDFYNISPIDLSAQLSLFLGRTKVGEIIMADTEDELDLYLGMAWPSRQGQLGGPKKWQELERISVINPTGQRIHPASLVRFRSEESLASIVRKNGRTSVQVFANDEERTTSEILDDFQPQLDEMQQTWPPGYGYRLGGEAEEMEEIFSSAKKAFVFAVLLIFATLALIFGSFKQTLIIMLSVPFALTGTFLGFFLSGMELSANAAVGIIALTGIAVNDAIVLIETMNNYHRNGLSVKEAATRGAGDRLRPILSTSITTIVGLIPLALHDVEWRPLCNAIIFGLIASTLISLYVIPALYLLFTSQQKKAAS